MAQRELMTCPHCAKNEPHEILYMQDDMEQQMGNGDGARGPRVGSYVVSPGAPQGTDWPLIGEKVDLYLAPILLMCTNCKQVTLVGDSSPLGYPPDYDDSERSFAEATEILYPRFSALDPSVPEDLRRNYLKCRRALSGEPTAFVLMIRTALEFIAKKNDCHEKELRAKMKELGVKGIIPSRLAEAADSIVWLGNRNAHRVDEEITEHEAELLDDFYQAIVEYVYIGPAKLKALNSAIDRRKEK